MRPVCRQGILDENRHKLSAIFRGTTLSSAVPLKKLRKFLAKLRKSLKLFHLSLPVCYNAYTIFYVFPHKVDRMWYPHIILSKEYASWP